MPWLGMKFPFFLIFSVFLRRKRKKITFPSLFYDPIKTADENKEALKIEREKKSQLDFLCYSNSMRRLHFSKRPLHNKSLFNGYWREKYLIAEVAPFKSVTFKRGQSLSKNAHLMSPRNANSSIFYLLEFWISIRKYNKVQKLAILSLFSPNFKVFSCDHAYFGIF